MASIFEREWVTKSGERKRAWRVKFMVGKKPRFRQFKTERKAKKFLESVSQERARLEAKGISLDSPTFAEVANAWLAARTSGSDGNPPLRAGTVQWYQGQLTNHILPVLGQFRVAELRRQDVKAFRARLLSPSPGGTGTLGSYRASSSSTVSSTPATYDQTGEACPPVPSRRPYTSSQGLSRRTAAKLVTTVRQILGFALEEEIVEKDPSERVTVRFASADRTEIAIHSVAEVRAILATARSFQQSTNLAVSKPWQRYYPMLLVLVYCGLRISEVRGLDCKDVNFGRKCVRVRQRADYKGDLGSPKSRKGHRDVHFPEEVEACLRVLVESKHHGLLFRTKSGRPVDTANFRKRAWEKIQVAANVPVLTLHSLRHFFASRQIEHGVNPKELAALMGHADEAFTLRVYGHLFKDADTEQRRRERANALTL